MAILVVKATRSDKVFTHQCDVLQLSVRVLKLQQKNNKNQLSKQSIQKTVNPIMIFLPDSRENCFSFPFATPSPSPLLPLRYVPPTNSFYPPVIQMNRKGRYFRFTKAYIFLKGFPVPCFHVEILLLVAVLLSSPKRIDTSHVYSMFILMENLGRNVSLLSLLIRTSHLEDLGFKTRHRQLANRILCYS